MDTRISLAPTASKTLAYFRAQTLAVGQDSSNLT